MFWLLNKSAIWLLCQCINHCLWNSSKLPFIGAVLQSTSPSNPPATGSRLRGWLVSRLVVWNFPSYPGAQIHSLGRCTFQGVDSANCVICKHTSFGRSGRLLKYCVHYIFVRIWQPAVCGNLFLNNHKKRNRPWTAVFIKKPTETYRKSENGNRYSTTIHHHHVAVEHCLEAVVTARNELRSRARFKHTTNGSGFTCNRYKYQNFVDLTTR